MQKVCANLVITISTEIRRTESRKESQLERNVERTLKDHDHNTGKIRALLCNNCNLLLGMVNDSISYLEQLIHYLEAFNPGVGVEW